MLDGYWKGIKAMSISEKTEAKEPNDRKVAGSRDLRVVPPQNAATINFMELRGGTGGSPGPQERSDGAWNSTEFSIYDQGVAFILQRVESLMEKMDNMSQEIADLKDAVLPTRSEGSSAEPDDGRENLMELTRDEVKAVILQLYEQDKELDYYDIISRFDVDLELVIQICAELEDEGKLEVIEYNEE